MEVLVNGNRERSRVLFFLKMISYAVRSLDYDGSSKR